MTARESIPAIANAMAAIPAPDCEKITTLERAFIDAYVECIGQ
jgi:hypothetical protein